MPRPLPRELMEQIFGEPVLPKSTLARCCRLSKGWVDFFRDRLYSHITIDLFSKNTYSPDYSLCHEYSSWTLDMLRLLSRYSAVAGCVRSVRFEHEWTDGCGVMSTPLALFASILRLCPSIESLSFPLWNEEVCFPHLKEVCAETGRRFSTVDLGKPCDEMWSLLDVLQDKLAHLEFGNVQEAGWSVSEPPPVFLPALHLRSLSLPQGDYSSSNYTKTTIDALLRHSHQSLESLEIEFSYDLGVDLSPFISLSRLVLHIAGDSRNAGQALRTLIRTAGALTRLELKNSLKDASAVEAFVGSSPNYGFASSLSVNLTHLILPNGFLTSHILTFLQHLPLSHPLRYLEFQRKRHGPNERMKARRGQPVPPEEDYSQVEEVCRERGIELKMT